MSGKISFTQCGSFQEVSFLLSKKFIFKRIILFLAAVTSVSQVYVGVTVVCCIPILSVAGKCM